MASAWPRSIRTSPPAWTSRRCGRSLPTSASPSWATRRADPFEIEPTTAARLLVSPNPDGRSNAEVVRPWMNGEDVTGRPRGYVHHRFRVGHDGGEAALYEAPFEYVRSHVRAERLRVRRLRYAEHWWLHVEPRPGLRAAMRGLTRYIATPRVSKHRLFIWVDPEVLPDSRLIVFARHDDYIFGVLHSRVHEVWSLATGPRHETSRPTYTPTTCFETFPFPPTPRPTSEPG